MKCGGVFEKVVSMGGGVGACNLVFSLYFSHLYLSLHSDPRDDTMFTHVPHFVVSRSDSHDDTR